MLDFVNDNNYVLYDYQYRLRISHSTQHANITCIDRITKSLDKGHIKITILLDLKKTFDTVDHRILLRKLCTYSFLLQKKEIIRTITFLHYLAHTEPLFMSLEILPLEKIVYHRCVLMMYKYHNNLLPCSISQLYAKNDSIHDQHISIPMQLCWINYM